MTVSLHHTDAHWEVARAGLVLGRFRRMKDAVDFMEMVLYQAV